jgi:hypothetical protein
MTAALPVIVATAQVNVGGAGRRTSLAERGYVEARFGGLPVLVGPELAAQLRAIRQSREGGSLRCARIHC